MNKYKCKHCHTESDEMKECCGENMEEKCEKCGKVKSECQCDK